MTRGQDKEDDDDKRHRHWCFVHWFHKGAMKDPVRGVDYMIIGEEVCPDTGRLHGQAYVYFKDKVSFKVAKNRLERKDCPGSIGKLAKKYTDSTPEQAANYCKKDKKILVEIGEVPKQGGRSDYVHMRTMLKEGANMEEICDEVTSGQAVRSAELLLKYIDRDRPIEEVEVVWIWGGWSKRKRKMEAYKHGEEKKYVALDDKWWDGYDGHKTVLFEEVEQGQFSEKRLDQLTDMFPFRVAHKGGSRKVAYTKIIFTSEDHPKSWACSQELQARMTFISCEKECPEVGSNTSPDLCNCAEIDDSKIAYYL